MAAKPRRAATNGRDALTRQDNFLSAGDFFTFSPRLIDEKKRALGGLCAVIEFNFRRHLRCEFEAIAAWV